MMSSNSSNMQGGQVFTTLVVLWLIYSNCQSRHLATAWYTVRQYLMFQGGMPGAGRRKTILEQEASGRLPKCTLMIGRVVRPLSSVHNTRAKCPMSSHVQPCQVLSSDMLSDWPTVPREPGQSDTSRDHAVNNFWIFLIMSDTWHVCDNNPLVCLQSASTHNDIPLGRVLDLLCE